MKNTVLFKDWLYSLSSLFFPRCCIVCNDILARGEECLCTICNINLPRTNLHLVKDNHIEQLFWGKVSLERATSFFFYRKGSDFRQILHQLKYGGRKEIGAVMGRYMAAELLPSGFFEGIDIIVPMPLHKKKQRQRGYNQSEWISRGISLTTGIPIDSDSVVREKNTETQTHKSTFERWENVDGIFRLRYPGTFEGKHVLVIDDVLTTGATMVACVSAISQAKDIKVSILTLAIAE